MKSFIMKYKFYIIGLIVIIFGFFLFFRRNNVAIIDSVNGIFVYDGKWKYSRNYNNFNGKYYIYDGDSYIGRHNLIYENGWNIYDKKKIVSYDYGLFATSSKKISLVNVNESHYDSDVKYINEYLYNTKGIYNIYDSFDYSSYYYDFDSDGIDEVLFIITDFSLDNESIMHSYVFIYDSGNYYDIKDSVTSDLSSIQLFSLSRIFRHNGRVNFIINIDFFSNPEKMCQELFTFDKTVHNLYECEWVM